MVPIANKPGLIAPDGAPVLVYTPVIEQAMAWLIENGPLVSDPPLPLWALKRLVAARRLVRLHRGLYLAPSPDGRLASLLEIAAMVLEEGYVSFSAALFHHGLTDQDPRVWTAVVPSQRSPLHLGQRELRFLTSATLATSGRRTAVEASADLRAHIATLVQALLDCLAFPKHGPPVVELAQSLQTAITRSDAVVGELTEAVVRQGTPTLARRLGVLLTVIGEDEREEVAGLRAVARRTHDISELVPGMPTVEINNTWRTALPAALDGIVRQLSS